MQSFLGLANYYRRFIPQFAEYSDSLYKAGQDKHIVPTPELEKDFAGIKNAACAISILKIPDPDIPFILETDASAIAVGGVLI